ncbi:MAG: twin-arginine translocation signal domain-containing protein [Gemmatimonadaceae bacterium]
MGRAPALDNIDRRRFLQLIGGAAAATVGTACSAGPVVKPAVLARPDLVDALGDERVRELGRRYREMSPSERDVESLHAAIRRSLPWSARLSGSTTSQLAHLVHDDFDAGRTVVVRGWILSATEARQCALFSLLPV